MARYDTRPWRWTSARTCSSISSKFTVPPPPSPVFSSVCTGLLTEEWSSYEHTIALRAPSENVHLLGRVFGDVVDVEFVVSYEQSKSIAIDEQPDDDTCI